MVLPYTQRIVDWRNSQLHWQFASCPPGALYLSLVSSVIDGRCMAFWSTNQIQFSAPYDERKKSHKMITPFLIINP